MVPYETGPGQTPRKIKIERNKRLYMEQDIEKLLEEKGVSLKKTDEPEIFPLEAFDDFSFDPRPAEEWKNFAVVFHQHSFSKFG
jgi:dynein heavy chain